MLRTTAANLLDGIGAFSTLLRVRSKAPNPFVTVLTYHRIGDPEGVGDFDPGVVDARIAAFDGQLAYLKEHCSVIDLDQLAAFVRGEPLPPNPVLVTFDDGYLDNHDVALPLLQKHGVRAVFFITTHYVTERRLFWWDRASLLLRRSKKEVLELTYPKTRRIMLGPDEKSRAQALKSALAPVKAHWGLDVRRYLEELEVATGVTFSREEEKQLAEANLLTWDHIRAMRKAGMSIQSHTRSHRILVTLDDKALDEELGGAREELEHQLGEKVIALAYPVGRTLSSAPAARRAIRRNGYELAFSNGTGLNTTFRFDPLDIKRLSLEVDLTDAYFRGMVALPYFAPEPHGEKRRPNHAY